MREDFADIKLCNDRTQDGPGRDSGSSSCSSKRACAKKGDEEVFGRGSFLTAACC